MLTGDKRDVGGIALEGLLQPHVVIFMHGGDDDKGTRINRRTGEIEIFGDQAIDVRK